VRFWSARRLSAKYVRSRGRRRSYEEGVGADETIAGIIVVVVMAAA
jgi:hypothetical protein